MHETVERVFANADQLGREAERSDSEGRLTANSVSLLKRSQGVRLLQPKEYEGYEAHPNDFLEWVMAVAATSPPAGWVAGVVGVHPWEIAIMDPRVAEEIWGNDPDTWAASPYAPFGRARRVDGGFLLSGRWPYSTGTEHCQWVILGGMVAGDDGEPLSPPDVRHFVLPRQDYEVVQDSWNVVGLAGTGSKDVRMKDVFVPDYRVTEASKMLDGLLSEDRQPGKPLYRMMFALMFSSAITAATIGIAEGAVRSYSEYTAQRVSVGRGIVRTDPYQLTAFGEASAEVSASRLHLLHIISELYDHVSHGGDVSISQRLEFRRSQVRAARRAIDGVEKLFNLSGAGALDLKLPLQRYWRDMHAAGNHICNVAEPIYHGWGLNYFGGEIPPGMFI